MKLTILVTTMHQNDFAVYDKMNLQTDAVIANQCGNNGYQEETHNGKFVKLVSTTSRGLSRNRNIALAHASQDSDYLMFSDDDLVFNDGYEQMILDEFEKHPEAEAIKFNLHDLSKTRKISMRRIQKWGKCTRRNMSSAGVCGVAIKQKTLKRIGLYFNENFGSGTANYCGEDTIFLQAMINAHVSFYRSPIDIAGIDQSESTWFKGYDKHYFEVSGMILGKCYPHIAKLLAVRSAHRRAKEKRCDFDFTTILKAYLTGIKKVKKGEE